MNAKKKIIIKINPIETKKFTDKEHFGYQDIFVGADDFLLRS